MDLGFNTVSIDAVANTMTVGGSVHFANLTGPLYNAWKEWRRPTSPSPRPHAKTTHSCHSHDRSRLVLLRRHCRRHSRRRRRVLRRPPRPPDRRSPISPNGDGDRRLARRLGDQPPRPLVGNARRRLQLRHRHLGHLLDLRLHQRRPGH